MTSDEVTAPPAAMPSEGVPARLDRARHLSSSQAQRRRQLRRRRAVAVVVLLVVVIAPLALWRALAQGGGASAAVTIPTLGTSVAHPVYLPSLVSLVPELTSFPGAPPVLPFPSSGQSAVFVQGVGLLGASPTSRPCRSQA